MNRTINKTAGIVCDNYKVDKFKEELDKKEFEYKIRPYKGKTSLIKVFTTVDKVKTVQNICTQVELHFKHQN